ncbi:MAG: hypothetical protein QHH10_13120 [Peptococcaceae bacterium]|jgi:succinate-acetate transporter protein|nr:hypothetical protein [Peptococcaceae bacterium]MDH7526240.1 hypothetical protein [Peptococcaceae bacterium]
MNAVNPEAIGVFGLIITVWCFGVEQLGLGVKGGDHKDIGKSLAYIAIFFGGAAQVLTAIAMYFFNVAKNPEISIYLGTVFADYGIFWLIIGTFFLKGGDRKMIAHFFFVQFLISSVFLYKAILLGKIWPLGAVLALICGLFLVLVPAWYGKGAVYTKIAGALNVLIGLAAVPIFLGALGL